MLSMKDNKDIHNFWVKKEKEKNSKLVIATACEYLSGYKSIEGPVYGLLYLMKNGFYFENFEEKSFMKDLFLGKEEFNKINFSISLKDIEQVKTGDGYGGKGELSFFKKVLKILGFSSNVLSIKIKNNRDCLFKCIESPFNICERYYELNK